MIESIQELRKICQAERDKEYEKMGWLLNWLITGILRKISIYFTKLFLKMGISANQVTLLSFSVGMLAGAFLLFANPEFWIIGGFLYCLHFLFDTCDGEIARYTRSKTIAGAFFDDMNASIVWPYIVGCMSFGIYNVVHSVGPFIFAFVAIICLSSYSLAPQMAYRLLGLNGQSVCETKESLPATLKQIPSAFKFGSAIFCPNGLALAIIVVALIDYCVLPFTISSLPGFLAVTNARYLYLIMYSAAWLVGAILTAYYISNRVIKRR